MALRAVQGGQGRVRTQVKTAQTGGSPPAPPSGTAGQPVGLLLLITKAS